MRKILMLLLASFFMLGLNAQQIVVSGVVTNDDGTAAPNIDILVEIPSNSPVIPGYSNELLTDDLGAYEDIIPIDPNQTQGIVFVSMFDCNGDIQTQVLSWFPGMTDLEANFVYCENIIVPNCDVTISVDSTAAGAVLTANATGTAPFTYLWSTGETTQSVALDPAIFINYCVIITDADGCVAEECMFNFPPNDCFVEIELDSSNAGLVLTANATGTAPFTYEWNTGETTQTIPYSPAGQISCVVVTDADGCVAENCYFFNGGWDCEVVIYEDSSAIGGLVLTADATGTAPFTYLWDNGETTQSITPDPNALEHCVVVTDADGCVSTACYWFNGGGDCGVWLYYDCPWGSIPTIYAENWGTGPFTYLWSTGETTETINPDESGEYCVTITDAEDCVAENCIWVDVIPLDSCGVFLLYDCPLGATPTLTANSFGVAPFTYLWNTGETTETISPDESGEYCVTVTDAEDCVAEACMWVDLIPFDSCGVNITLIQGGTYLNAEGWGVAPFTYEWSNGSTDQAIQIDPNVNTYCVVVTDAEGCVAEACFTVVNPGDCEVVISELADSSNVTLLWAEIFGNPNDIFEYAWSNGETTPFIFAQTSGTYCVTVTSITTGCVAEDCFELTLSPNPTIGGWVFVNDSLQVPIGMFGSAYLFKLDPNTGTPQQVDQQDLMAFPFGYRYEFVDLEDGEYLVRVVIDPDSPGFDDYLPTYFGNTELWDNASVITLPNNTANPSYDIFLVDADGLVGPGTIGGEVFEGNGLIGSDDRGEGDPVEGVSIILYDELESPIATAITNNDGAFEFSSLPWGTYKVLIEITGKDHAHYWVTIGPDNPNVVDLIFEVNEDAATTGINDVLVNQSVQIFPNPTSADLNIVFELSNNLDAQITLTDVTGKVVFFENRSLLTGKQHLNINIADLPNGVFFANITTGKNVISQKVIKH